MCGRYQFTEPQNADLRRILQDVRRRCGDRAQDFRFGDVMPTAAAPVLIANGGKVVADLQTWGIPGWKGGLMINARAETVCEKPMFRRSMAAQRCVIPATSFYEWDAARHKYQFALPGEPLYLAGLYDNVDMRRVVFQAVQHILDMLSFKFQESGLHYLCRKLVPRNTDTAAFGTDRVQHEFHQLIQSNPICRIVLCQSLV